MSRIHRYRYHRAGFHALKPGLLSALLALLLYGALPAQAAAPAADEEEAVVDPRGLVYIELGPPFVTNYDGGGRLKYLKARVTLRAQGAARDAITLHLPYIRNRLVVLFSSQLEEDLTSTEGKDRLQRTALLEVREALRLLESQSAADAVVNLYFSEFVIQS